MSEWNSRTREGQPTKRIEEVHSIVPQNFFPLIGFVFVVSLQVTYTSHEQMATKSIPDRFIPTEFLNYNVKLIHLGNQSINQSSLRLFDKKTLLTQTQEGCAIELKK